MTATENQMKVRRSAALPTAPIPADPQSAQVLSGRYRLGARIGSGGMADVYEGVDTRLRRPVAVKVFRPGHDPQSEDRLTSEAVLLARLHHPGLVTVYDAGRHDDRTYLVMELVNGPTLRGLLACGALPQRRAAEMGAGLARALAHVHRAGIVHRDVKPSNVLLDTAGDPHLADFGIALLANATRHTAPDVLTGTAAYLAPEQVEGRRVGPATDVYALGLVLLECLKGELEYQGSPLEAAIARLHRPPSVPTWFSSDLAALLRAMTAQDPEARPDAHQCEKALATLTIGNRPYPLPLSGPPVNGLPAPRAARPDADEPVRTERVAAARGGLPDGARHNRRLTVGTALAALSVALGTALAVAPGIGGNSDDHTEAASTASTPAHPPSSTPAPESSPSAAPSTGSRTEPVSRLLGASDRTAPTDKGPARRHGTGAHKSGPHHSGGADHHGRHAPHGTPDSPGKAHKPTPGPTGQEDG
ncbi:protein kinase domain-containing protein [Streptomyces sp. NPDC004561]